MLNCKMHLICKFDAKICVVCRGAEIFNVNTLNSLSDEIDLVLEDVDNFCLNIYPIMSKKNQCMVAYSCQFEVVGTDLMCVCKQAKLFKLPENNYICLLEKLSLSKELFEGYDKIEAVEGKIKALKLLNNISKRGIVDVFQIDGDKPEKLESYTVSLGESKVNNDYLKLLDFFECFQCGDYSSAISNFSYNLSEKLNKKILKDFLGEYTRCMLVSYFSQPSVVILNEKNKQARVFSAHFENGLIDNIFEIE